MRGVLMAVGQPKYPQATLIIFVSRNYIDRYLNKKKFSLSAAVSLHLNLLCDTFRSESACKVNYLVPLFRGMTCQLNIIPPATYVRTVVV